jgi:hypothetical protein
MCIWQTMKAKITLMPRRVVFFAIIIDYDKKRAAFDEIIAAQLIGRTHIVKTNQYSSHAFHSVF